MQGQHLPGAEWAEGEEKVREGQKTEGKSDENVRAKEETQKTQEGVRGGVKKQVGKR